jgi:hypothetical protein
MNDWLDRVVKTFNEVELMNIPFTEKIRILIRLKEETSSKFSKEFMLEYMNPDSDTQKISKEFYERGINIFIEIIKTSQLKGEVRKDIKPEFLYVVLNKIVELAKDQELVSLYPRISDFSMELNNFIYFGLLPFDALDNGNENN